MFSPTKYHLEVYLSLCTKCRMHQIVKVCIAGSTVRKQPHRDFTTHNFILLGNQFMNQRWKMSWAQDFAENLPYRWSMLVCMRVGWFNLMRPWMKGWCWQSGCVRISIMTKSVTLSWEGTLHGNAMMGMHAHILPKLCSTYWWSSIFGFHNRLCVAIKLIFHCWSQNPGVTHFYQRSVLKVA